MGIPIPLGGTSNHFRIKTLNALYAWDPYNVTEDADLGVRIAQKGWRSTIIDSTTLEECPITITAWIKQRSRWIKGHLQTYFVHMR
ncbi:MAG: putative glycosyltransferase, partial [Rickettsiaceae bacterium]|nr:putative glycosyltransferase [Rickettsiaceae bacterium]